MNNSLNHDFIKIYKMSRIEKQCHCGLDPQSPAKRRRHSEQSEESVANFRGLPRPSYLTARNDGTAFCRDVACRVLTRFTYSLIHYSLIHYSQLWH